MKVSRFASTAAPERPRLASPGQILGFGLMVCLALLAVFPGQDLERRLENSAYGDSISMSYLGAWLRAKPDDHHLRLILARRLVQQGQPEAAEASLAPLLAGQDLQGHERAEAELMVLELRERQLWRETAAGPAQQAAKAAYLAQLRRVTAYRWEVARLEGFAQQAMDLGDTVLGRELYIQLVRDNPYHSLPFLERIARLDLAQGRYREAAAIYFHALPYTADLAQRRRFFLAGLRVLQSGNLLGEALAAGRQHLGPLGQDSQTLTVLVRLALAGRRPDLAEHYVARLLRQRVSPPSQGEGP